jgi:hypothetical protein
MPLGQIRLQPDDYPAETLPCLRCGTPAPMRFAGACPSCTEQLRAAMRAEAREVESEYVPKMNVTPNAVAMKDD